MTNKSITSRTLEDPCIFLSRNRRNLKNAITLLLRRLYGEESNPPQDMLLHLIAFLDDQTKTGLMRENYRTSISLNPIESQHFLWENQYARNEYYEASYETSYEVSNISGKGRKYRAKLRLENHDYEGIPLDKGIVINRFNVEIFRKANNEIVKSEDVLSEIKKHCNGKLSPSISMHATIFIDLSEDDNDDIQKLLDRMLTFSIRPTENLRVSYSYTMYLKKQDFHLSNMSYFTQGFTMKLKTPEVVDVSFNARFSGPCDRKPAKTKSGFSTHVWTTKAILHPNEGGIAWWRTKNSSD